VTVYDTSLILSSASKMSTANMPIILTREQAICMFFAVWNTEENVEEFTKMLHDINLEIVG
jgi:hypothetical protein